ncbi:phosphoesterase [Pseudomonas phage Lu11]|uniref:phosphoesterase n=1 Tax=Pseudomonas phage Lu11 TaxID=1161927 RepID=UPI00025F1500|nr:phosphoesterase [Pseudomonas phage Lu11]AFH14569.1 putative serine/threonine phosphatase [Pseudomonas phage Lu11]
MAAYLISDLHLGHENIPKYRDFPSLEAHDEFVLNRIADTVRSTKRATMYVLGDVAFTREGWERFDALPGNKIVILGNHDTERTSRFNVAFIESLKTVNSVHSLLNINGMILSHAPLHPAHLRGKINVHGHLHGDIVKDRRYFNMSMEQLDYRPWSLEQLRDEMVKRRSLSYVYSRLGAEAVWRSLWETAGKNGLSYNEYRAVQNSLEMMQAQQR